MRKWILYIGSALALGGCTTAYHAPDSTDTYNRRCFEDTTEVIVNENTDGLREYRSCRQARTGGGYVHRLENWLGRNAQQFCQRRGEGHYRLIRKYVGQDGFYPSKRPVDEQVFRKARVEIVFVCTKDPSQASVEKIRNQAK